MKALHPNELSKDLREIYSFLDTFAHPWVKRFYPDYEAFTAFLDDEEIHVLAYATDKDDLCCVIILDENAILVSGFSHDAENEEAFSAVLHEIQVLVKDAHFLSIYYGTGSDSFGVYYDEKGKNPFGDFLKQNGFAVESVAYDIRHDTASFCQESLSKKNTVKRVPPAHLKDFSELNPLESMIDAFKKDLCQHPSDVCYIVVNPEGRIFGYALLDPVSYVIDCFNINEKNPVSYKEAKQALLSAIASELYSAGIQAMIERRVDQVECQKIKHAFEVCGTYESLLWRQKT